MGNEQMLVTMTVGQLRQLIREEMAKEIGNLHSDKQPPQIQDDGLLTIDDLASYLKCSRQTIHNHVKAGKLPKPHRIGRRALWDKAVIDRLLSNGQSKL